MSTKISFPGDLKSPYLELERAQRERLLRYQIYATVGITTGLVIPYARAAIVFDAPQALVVNALQVPMFVLLFLSYRQLRRGELVAAGSAVSFFYKALS